jgi:hypothetical protein
VLSRRLISQYKFIEHLTISTTFENESRSKCLTIQNITLKSTDKDRKIDLLFKQATLSEKSCTSETVTANETASSSEKLPSTVTVSYHNDVPSRGFKSFSDASKSDTVVPVTDQMLFSSNKYELKIQ